MVYAGRLLIGEIINANLGKENFNNCIERTINGKSYFASAKSVFGNITARLLIDDMEWTFDYTGNINNPFNDNFLI